MVLAVVLLVSVVSSAATSSETAVPPGPLAPAPSPRGSGDASPVEEPRVEEPRGSAGDELGGPVDACGCRRTQGEGWSSTAASCVDGARTSAAEATACGPPPTRPPTAEQACARLLSDKDLDCGACLARLPPLQQSCEGWSAADDRAAERAALFPDGRARSLYNSTDWLWEEEMPIRRVELSLSDENWAFLLARPDREQYVTGAVRLVEGRQELGTWDGVGIRFKGSIGSLRQCVGRDGEDITESSAFGVCNKLSMKVKFNYVDRTQRFFGLKTILLHGAMSDNSVMRERLAYSIFREVGVPTARQTHIDVRVATPSGDRDGAMGLHLLTENLDGRFTESYFAGGDGNLFKEIWPVTDNREAVYTPHLKTNEEQADASRMVEFGSALAAATNDWELVRSHDLSHV